nr:MAG TPA: hypothetical protein [Caudoviricetes sp.]
MVPDRDWRRMVLMRRVTALWGLTRHDSFTSP